MGLFRTAIFAVLAVWLANAAVVPGSVSVDTSGQSAGSVSGSGISISSSSSAQSSGSVSTTGTDASAVTSTVASCNIDGQLKSALADLKGKVDSILSSAAAQAGQISGEVCNSAQGLVNLVIALETAKNNFLINALNTGLSLIPGGSTGGAGLPAVDANNLLAGLAKLKQDLLNAAQAKLIMLFQTIENAKTNLDSEVQSLNADISNKFDQVKSELLSCAKTAEAKAAIKAAIQAEMDKALAAIQATANAMKSNIDNTKQAITSSVNGALDAVNVKLQTVANSIQNLINTKVKAAQTLFNTIKGKIDDVGAQLQSCINTKLDAAKSLLQSLGTDLQALLGQVGALVGNLLANLKITLGNLLANLGATVQGLVNGVLGTVNGLLSGVTGLLNNLKDQLAAKVQELAAALQPMKDAIKPKAEAVIGAVTDAVNNAKEATEGVLSNLQDEANTVVDDLKAHLSNPEMALGDILDLVGSFEGNFQNALGQCTQAWNEDASAVDDALSQLQNDIKQHITKKFEVLQSVLAGIPSDLRAKLAGDLQAVASAIASGFNQLGDVISQAQASTQDAMNQLAESKAACQAKLDAIKEAIQDAKSQLEAKLNEEGLTDEQKAEIEAAISKLNDISASLQGGCDSLAQICQKIAAAVQKSQQLATDLQNSKITVNASFDASVETPHGDASVSQSGSVQASG